MRSSSAGCRSTRRPARRLSRVDRRTVGPLAGFPAADAPTTASVRTSSIALAAVPAGPIPFTLPGDAPEHVYVTRSTADLFDVLRVQPQVGRLFSPEHEIQGNHRVVLISDALWRRRFGADPGCRQDAAVGSVSGNRRRHAASVR